MRTGRNDWEELGAAEPYFSVLTDERFLRRNLTPEMLAEFHASGERDVERLLSLASGTSGAPLHPRLALDFGCGVGRLTIPMARRAARVVGIDAAPSMLASARSTAEAGGIGNVEFLPADALARLAPGSFDLVFSYIVFQHIPVGEGEACARKLLELAAPDATALLHFSLRRPGTPLRRLLRSLRSRSPLVHRVAAMLRRERQLPYMQMNEYDESRIVSLFGAMGFPVPAIVRTDHGGIAGGIFISTRRSGA